MNYRDFLESKMQKVDSYGFDVDRNSLNRNLFEYQKDVVRWALIKGRAALFEDCGLGKTLQQLEWANQIIKRHGGMVLILTPLAVAKQTAREGQKFGIEINLCRSEGDLKPGINITNYEMLHKFDPEDFIGVVLDESSILKSFTGKFRTEIIEGFKDTPYRLACTATPAPNDFMELGNHAEFLGVMSRVEMLSMYFVHDGGETSKWRLKGHAEDKFWEWVSEWAVVIENPKDLGYENRSYKLPELKINQIITESVATDALIPDIANTLAERREARKESINSRLNRVEELVEGSNEQWLIWCDYNYESESLRKCIKGSVEVKGSDKPEFKENSMMGFADGDVRILITKPSIAGFGMNWQNCSNMIFFGLSDSYEQFYQAVRRCWRFGQKNNVNVYVIISEKEISVLNNIQRKAADADRMKINMIKHTKKITSDHIKNTTRETGKYEPKIDMILPKWIGRNIVG